MLDLPNVVEQYFFASFKHHNLLLRLFQCPASNAALVEQEFEPLNYGLHVTVFYPAKILFLFTIASNLWFHGNFSSACKSETTESPSKIWQAYFSILRNQGRNCLVLTDWSTVSNSKSFRTFQSNILIKTTLFIINACFTIIRSKKVQPIFSMLI